jgi:hypothetical protein
MTGDWRRLHNEELHNSYAYSGDQIKEDEMGGACSMHERDEKYNIWVGKSEWKSVLGRPKRRWKMMLEWIQEK